MLVSLAVLVLALSVVSVVFTTTTRTAGQAAAYSETLNRVRQYTLQIEEDLKYCVPSQSILVLGGRTVPAGLTQADLDAGRYSARVLVGNPAAVPAGFDKDFAGSVVDDNGVMPPSQYSDPRADILMFISNRPNVSQAPATSSTLDPNDAAQAFQLAAQGGVKLSPAFVTYAQAALGRAVWDGTTYLFPQDALQHIEQLKNVGGRSLSVIPANRWHLSRVAKIIEPSVPGLAPKVGLSPDERLYAARCQAYPENNPDPTLAGDIVVFDLAPFLWWFGPNGMSPALATEKPYDYPTRQWANVEQTLNSLLYASDATANLHHVATVLDEVPLELRGNLGVQMLPGCAWFQVEFLMPEDPRNSVEYTPDASNIANVPNPSPRSDMPRWTSVQAGQTYVFVPDTAENRELVARQVDSAGYATGRLASYGRVDQDSLGDQHRPYTALYDRNNPSFRYGRMVRLWPYAIRVTVRAYDRQGRLPEPIVRSVVHRFE